VQRCPVEQANPDGTTALTLSCESGHLECVRALLEAGAQVPQAMQSGTTALMLACWGGRATWSVRALLEVGALVAQATQRGTTALMRACAKAHLECVRALLAAVHRWSKPGRPTSLH
jgi:ankyrin repeat protein